MVWSVAQVGNDIENVAGAEAWLRGVPVSSLEINAAGVGVGKARIYSGGFDRLGERRL
jgi:hypothetical protein